jgi:hypothetical protein
VIDDWLDAVQWPAMAVTLVAAWLIALQVELFALNVRGAKKNEN